MGGAAFGWSLGGRVVVFTPVAKEQRLPTYRNRKVFSGPCATTEEPFQRVG